MQLYTQYQVLTDFFLHTSALLAHFVGFIGVVIMAYGSLYSGWLFITCARKSSEHLPKIRVSLAKHLSLGLEFLVGKDIIETIIEPTWEDLGKLAVIVALRTVVTIFLSWEQKEVLEQVKEEQLIHKSTQ